MPLVEQLRYYASQMKPSGLGGPGYALSPDRAKLLEQAADEIEQMSAAVDRAGYFFFGHVDGTFTLQRK